MTLFLTPLLVASTFLRLTQLETHERETKRQSPAAPRKFATEEFWVKFMAQADATKAAAAAKSKRRTK